MAAIAKAMTDDEMKAAADYYAAIPFKPWITVKESSTAPKTRINVGLFLALPGNEDRAARSAHHRSSGRRRNDGDLS